MSGPTPSQLKPLEEQVDQTVKLLRDPAVDKPEMRLKGVVLDFGEIAEDLETGMQSFRTVRSDFVRAGKSVEESKVAKDKAIKEFLAAFPWIAQTLEALARLVDERKLADRIRSSARRITRNQAEEDDTASSDTASSDEASASASSEETGSASAEETESA